MGRPAKHSVDFKARVVLSVLRGEGEQTRLTAQVDDLTHALGEAHVELRLLRREGRPPTQSWR